MKPQGNSNLAGRIRESLLRWRDRKIADPRFQRWAARFPLTRLVARRKASTLFDIAAGFVYSQVLFACVQLGLFEKLASGPRTPGDLAAESEMPEEGMLRLLRAAAALHLLQARGTNQFGLGDLGAAMLGNPGVAAMVGHHHRLYQDLADPLALLRGEFDTQLSGFWPYARGTEGNVTDYSELMAASQSLVAGDILDAYPMGQHHHLWDIAGGNGTFATSALARWPQLRATVLDLEGVATIADQRFKAAGLEGRAQALAGDMFSAPLQGRPIAAPLDGGTPAPYSPSDVTGEAPGADAFPVLGNPDLVTLVRVVHDHDDGPVRELFRHLHESMPPGGRLVIAEPMADTPGAEAMGHAYFGLYLWAMGSGKPRSLKELTALLNEAGFRRCREQKTARPLMVRLLVAER